VFLHAISYTAINRGTARSWDDPISTGNCIHNKIQRMAVKRKSAVSPARAAAFDILLRVEEEDSYASELLHAQTHARLSAADHALATELVMGVLRWRSALDAELATASTQKIDKLDREVLTALRMGIYQLRHLQRVPARAAIHESVELVKQARKRSAAPFVNAILRKLSAAPPRDKSKRADIAEDIASRYAHPNWLVKRWVDAFGGENASRICEYDQQVPETAIRLRTPEARERLREEGVELAPGLLLATAWRVKNGSITRTKSFREGFVSIQDEASQLVALLAANAEASEAHGRILDCCAAPGGKTAILAERHPELQVVAVELHSHRALLTRKLVPHNNVAIVAADARQLPFVCEFNRILVDAPCSGTGTLARNPDIKWRLVPSDLLELQGRQRAILEAALGRLAPGGRLVYSTCSLEKEENSDVVEEVLSNHPELRLIDCRLELQRLQKAGVLTWSDANSLVDGNYLRTLPGVHPCDGFFAAVLERSAADFKAHG
jgi:16S rRNA (cytosine967-C5)-methyltransferase